MIWLASVAMAIASPGRSGPAPVIVQASATVRILSGARLKLDSQSNPGAPRAHETKVIADGIRQPAHLIEFE